MELSERQIKQFARALMPEIYEMQAGCDMWMDIIAEMVKDSKKEKVQEQQEA